MKIMNHQHLLGKTKQEVIENLGSNFNYYHSDVWSYHLKTNWLGKKQYLLIHFKNEVVYKIKIKKSYAKHGY